MSSSLSDGERLVLRRALELVLSSDSNGTSAAATATAAMPPSAAASASPLPQSTSNSRPPEGLLQRQRPRLGDGGSSSSRPPEGLSLSMRRRLPIFPNAGGLRGAASSAMLSLGGVRQERLLGKRKVPPPLSSATWAHKFVCLSSSSGERVPSSKADKLLLEEAGLGEKVVTVNLEGSSDLFRQQLFEAFPKLEFGGGFELLQCLPHSRDLCLISPRVAASPRLLKRRVGNGRVYVRPIQKDLSLEEEERSEVQEIEETCLGCGKQLKVSSLRDHMLVCRGKGKGKGKHRPTPRSSGTSESKDHVEECPGASAGTQSEGDMPARSRASELEHQEDSSGDSEAELSQPSEEDAFDSEEDIEEQMMQKAMTESLSEVSKQEVVRLLQRDCGIELPRTAEDWTHVPRMPIHIRRGVVLHDALKAVRKRRFNSSKLLEVTFAGEEGWDTGGVSREFWRLLAESISSAHTMGGIFMKDITALANEDFRMMGKLIAVSIVQGGIGLPVLLPAVYRYIATSQYASEWMPGIQDFPDPLIRNLLQQIESSSTEEGLVEVFDDCDHELLLYEAGFKRSAQSLTLSDKAGLTKCLKLYTFVRSKPEVDQFCEGLKECGVLDAVKTHTSALESYFIHMPAQLTAEYVIGLFEVVFSMNDESRDEECRRYDFFKKYLKECEDSEDDSLPALADVMVFFTGAKTEPPLGFSVKPTLRFGDLPLATSSTCLYILHLPKWDTYMSFKEKMSLSVLGHGGLNKV